MAKCPQCGQEGAILERYEISCQESGYRDYGYQWRCAYCNAVSTEEEMEKANADHA